MKPGDFIEWVYKNNMALVVSDEELWSTPMQAWVPVGSSMLHLLVSITDEHISWFNENGFFHARVDDTIAGPGTYRFIEVLPRARG